MSLKDLLRQSIHKSGFMVRRFPTPLDQCYSRNALLNHLKIDHVLDVGANVGGYGSELRERGYRGKIISFEPVSTNYTELKKAAAHDSAWDAKNMALGAEDGQATINVAHTMSSMLDKNKDEAGHHFDFERTETVPLARLDTIWPTLISPGGRVHLKMDVQGFEMQVINGASEVLPNVSAIEIELSLKPIYANQPSFDEMYGRLRDAGFVMRQVWPHGTDGATGDMADFDAILVRKNG